MTSPLKGAIAKATGKAMKAMTFPLTYRKTTSTTAKAGAAYAIGVSTINVTNCPAGWGGVVPGDTFGTWPYVVANTVIPVNGTMTGVAFAPALTLALTSGAALSFTHVTDFTVRGFDTLIGAFDLPNTTILVGDTKFVLMADGIVNPPVVNDKIQTRAGKWLTIINVAQDPAGATWTVQARG